jgi:hypothetical protein
MMQKVLTKYWLTIHVGAVLFFAWLSLGQSRGQGLIPLLWLSLASVEAAVLLPLVHRGETLVGARTRVSRGVVKDPLLYIGLALVLFVSFQWLNSGCALMYLADADVWQFTPPALSWAPFSVEAAPSFTSVLVFTACLVGCLCLRHAVGLTGKRFLLQAAMTVSGSLAICLVWRASHGVAPYAGCARGLDGNSLGAFFGFWLVMGMGIFIDALARRQRGVEAFFVLGVVGNLVATLYFSSPLMLAVYVPLTLLCFIYWLSYLRSYVPQHVTLKLFVMSLIVVTCVTLAVLYVFPGNPIADKVKTLFPPEQFWRPLAETKEVRTAAALRIWQEHPWVGVGTDGFRHFVGSVVGDKDWRSLRGNPSSTYNDSLQFLCEYGLLGLGLLLAVVITLAVPICTRMRLAWKSRGTDESESRIFLFRISPLVLTGVVAAGACSFEGWFASPFRSPGVIMSWTLVLAIVPAFLPARVRGGAANKE